MRGGAGFRVGTVRLGLERDGKGITAWGLSGVASAEIAGLPGFTVSPSDEPGEPHPNGALRIDHLVVMTPDLGRTASAMEAAGLDLRRVRNPEEPGPPARQAFFRLGEVILEVVERPDGVDGPRFWGLTFAVRDLDACAALLGDVLGEVHDAVQPGRRIATIRRQAGLGVPVALISRERDRRAQSPSDHASTGWRER